jgi:hypothetical protein
MIERSLSQKIAEFITVVLALLPLFFINVKTSHDWGDDFAQYLHQAKNINAGLSQNNTGYVFNAHCFTGPQAYPVGFPLLLSPLVKTYGLDFYKLNLLQTAFLLFACVLGFFMLRTHLSFIASFSIALMVAYNPMLLNFKSEIISDLPFTCFSMFSLYLMQRKQSLLMAVVLGMAMAMSVHIRSVGVLLPIVYAFQQIVLRRHETGFSRKQYQNTGIALLTFLAVYAGIKFAWPCNTNYPGFFETEAIWENFNEHLTYNIYHLSMFFSGYPAENYWSIGLMASASFLTLSIFGAFHFFSQHKRSIYVYYVPMYLFLVLNYKYSHAGMRFIYPVLFFLFLFAAFGFKKLLQPWFAKQKGIALVLAGLVLFSYHGEVMRIHAHEADIPDGPMQASAVETFAYINTHLPANAVVAFDKPRALCLYTHVKSFAIYPAASNNAIAADLNQYQATHYLTHSSQSTEVLANYPLVFPDEFTLVYSNRDFKLYARRKKTA